MFEKPSSKAETPSRLESDKASFILEHAPEIIPLLGDSEQTEFSLIIEKGAVEEGDMAFVDSVIERFETKIFNFENSSADDDAKYILVTSDNPGSFRGMKPILRELVQDTRVRGVTALVSGIAGKEFAAEFPAFSQKREGDSVLANMLSDAEEHTVDIALASVSVQNGPEKPILYGGKGNFGAKKTYLVVDGWGMLSSSYGPDKQMQMEEIDGIFCNDLFAAKIVRGALPEYPEEKIHSFGMPGAEHLELEKAEFYREETRKRLDLASDAFVVLYIGDVSSDYKKLGLDENINIMTFEKTKGVLEDFARTHPELNLGLIVRPHPRARGTADADVLLQETNSLRGESKVLVRNGSNPFSINEVTYAADVIVSIVSTENLFAPIRGRRSVYLAYTDMGEKVLEDMYGAVVTKELGQVEGISKISSETDLFADLECISTESQLPIKKTEDATKDIVSTILS